MVCACGVAHRPAVGEGALSGNGSHKHVGSLKMLTTVVEGRVYDWSHSVGRNAAAGNGFAYPCSIALASNGLAYVVNRGGEGNQGSRVSKVSIGAPGAETVQGEFCRRGTSPGQGMWLNSVALDKQ